MPRARTKNVHVKPLKLPPQPFNTCVENDWPRVMSSGCQVLFWLCLENLQILAGNPGDIILNSRSAREIDKYVISLGKFMVKFYFFFCLCELLKTRFVA
jgi:hypothetical protein